MRRAGLLDKKPLTATNKMLAAAKKDVGTVKYAQTMFSKHRYTEYESRYYFRAAPSAVEGILEVCLFTRKDLAKGKKEPRFRIFLDYFKKDFESWDTVNEKWSRAKIDLLDTDDARYTYSYRGRNYAPETVRKLVNRFLGTGSMKDIETAVLDFQCRVRESELKNKHRLITDMIDGYMDTVPDKLPADWMRFINKKALEHCIFFERKSGAGYCTCCRLHVRVPDTARHNMPGKCACGSRITYKSWKKQKYVTYRTKASIIQKCTDGQNFVYRQFMVYMATEREKEYVPEIMLRESYRMIFRITDRKGPLERIDSYEWGNFKSTGVTRWCQEGTVSHGGYYYYGYSYGYAKSALYTSNLNRILKGTKLQYVPAADIIKGMEGTINVLSAFGDMGTDFPYEVFWKMGLKRFVRERIKRDGTDGLARRADTFQKPWQYLKISKEDMAQAVRIDATDQQMRIIQRAAELDVKLTDEQVLWLDENVGVSVLMRYFTIHTPHRIIRYLKEKVMMPDDKNKSAGKERLHFWTDYLDTAEQLHWDLRDRSVFFPQNIRRAHDEAANVFTLRENREKAAEMKEKDSIMHGYAKEIKKAFPYKNDRYVIKVPGCYIDFKREGQIQHNCVATYYEKALKGQCIILFIRKREAPNRPFCTVEIRNSAGKFTIIQNRTEYNKEAPEDAKEFMKAAVKAAQKIVDGMMKEEKEDIRIQMAV